MRGTMDERAPELGVDAVDSDEAARGGAIVGVARVHAADASAMSRKAVRGRMLSSGGMEGSPADHTRGERGADLDERAHVATLVPTVAQAYVRADNASANRA